MSTPAFMASRYTVDAMPLVAPFDWEPYSWSEEAAATDYDLVVSNGGGPVLMQSFDSSICGGATCTASPGVGLMADDYTWTVQAKDKLGNTSQQASPWILTAASSSLVTECEKVTHIGPKDGSEQSPRTTVFLEWKWCRKLAENELFSVRVGRKDNWNNGHCVHARTTDPFFIFDRLRCDETKTVLGDGRL